MSRGRRRDEYEQGYLDYRNSQALNRGRTANDDYYTHEYDTYSQVYRDYGSQNHTGFGHEGAYGWNRDYDRGYDDYNPPYAYNGGDNWNAYPQRNVGYEDYDSYTVRSGYSRDAYPSYESRYPSDGGYGNYRRPPIPTPESEYRYDRESYTSYRTSDIPANYREFSSYTRPPPPQRPRERSPPARPPIPLRTSPRPEYFSLASRASSHLGDPSIVRKLLVLDLNGSLLLRSAHKRAQTASASASWMGRGNKKRSPSRHDPDFDLTAPRGLRSVYPRPYLGAFVSYVFHESTKSWLDTMVWSSAQPHSVADMVEHCFGDRKGELKAVWARDTLGLSADDYHKKSVTLKDLEKPWAELADKRRPSSSLVTRSSRASPSPINSRSSRISPSPNTCSSNNPSSPAESPVSSRLPASNAVPATVHSAFTTLLVDDSPVKAALQPWNHLVINEYVQASRNMDLKVAEWEAATPAECASSPEIEAGELPENTRDVSSTSPPPPGMTRVIREVVMIEGTMVDPDKAIVEDKLVPTDEQVVLDKAQRRKAKKIAKKESVRAARAEKERLAFEDLRAKKAEIMGLPPPEPLPASGEATIDMHYDEMLLAVVGVLDCLKHEDNVAGWLHAGGLLKTPFADSTNAGEHAPASLANVETALSVSAGVKHAAPSRGESPASSSDEVSPAKRRRLSVSLGNVKNSEAQEGDKATQETPVTSLLSCSTPAQVGQAATGVPLSAPVPYPSGNAASEKISSTTKGHTLVGLWYEDKTVLEYWVARGRHALQALSIPVKSGIVPLNAPKKDKGNKRAA